MRAKNAEKTGRGLCITHRECMTSSLLISEDIFASYLKH